MPRGARSGAPLIRDPACFGPEETGVPGLLRITSLRSVLRSARDTGQK
jgi:hypothetical protein